MVFFTVQLETKEEVIWKRSDDDTSKKNPFNAVVIHTSGCPPRRSISKRPPKRRAFCIPERDLCVTPGLLESFFHSWEKKLQFAGLRSFSSRCSIDTLRWRDRTMRRHEWNLDVITYEEEFQSPFSINGGRSYVLTLDRLSFFPPARD